MKTEAREFLTASLLSSYPDAQFGDYVAELLKDELLELPESLRAMVEEFIASEDSLDNLRSEYIDLFDRGRSSNPLYETEYGRARAMVKGHELADISGFYKAFGLEFGVDGTQKDMVDHVAIELEFYALLLLKQDHLVKDSEGSSVVLDARKKFLQEHLGRFVGAITQRPGVKESPFYSTLFNWCHDLIQEECRELSVEVIPADWITGQQEPEMTDCMLRGPQLNSSVG
ncbi:MAG: molecular chaperone TorD family protein [Deltaproteobacteria bacterium]|nr:molecular chaperone TorD family protein [Deltaproteobacteria bacterium]